MRDNDQKLLWEKYNQIGEDIGVPEGENVVNSIVSLLRDVEQSDGYSDDDVVEGQAILDDAPADNRLQPSLVELAHRWDKSSPAYPLLQQLIQYIQPPSAGGDQWAAEESPRERSRQEMGWGQTPSRFGPTGDDARDYD